MAWPEVERVVAFKTDDFAVDTIWVSLQTMGDSEQLLFPDDARGWTLVVESLPIHLPGCMPFDAWFSIVAFPAFVENATLIFDRSAPVLVPDPRVPETNDKTEAERLRIGLTRGWIEVPTATAWADRTIAARETPDAVVVEIASAGTGDRAGVADLLSQVAGETDEVDVMRRCLADLRQWVDCDHRRTRQAASYLYEEACRGTLSEEHFGKQPLRLDDAFALAASGASGSIDDATADLMDFLDRYGRRA
ncbi:MAG TPA: hypothetical protein VGR62_19215 [Candidatus Binatia bacterium]|nr:hypothetical protein [Candidatus Binatia bacterium]